MATNRYKTKKNPDVEKTLGLLYVKIDIICMDLNMKGNSALQHKQEI